MPDNTWRKMRVPARHWLSCVLLLVLLFSQVVVLHADCVSHQDSGPGCCMHHPCGAVLAVPCTVTECCQSAMPIPAAIASQNPVRCSRDATIATALFPTVQSSNSDFEDSSSVSPPLPPLLRTCALRI
jgi:hypothetical protein